MWFLQLLLIENIFEISINYVNFVMRKSSQVWWPSSDENSSEKFNLLNKYKKNEQSFISREDNFSKYFHCWMINVLWPLIHPNVHIGMHNHIPDSAATAVNIFLRLKWKISFGNKKIFIRRQKTVQLGTLKWSIFNINSGES